MNLAPLSTAKNVQRINDPNAVLPASVLKLQTQAITGDLSVV